MKWDKSDTVVEVMQYDQYKIRMDGSGRVSVRNRKFLRKIVPFNSVSCTGHITHPWQTPITVQSAVDNLPQSPGHHIHGQAGGDHLDVPEEQTELDHTLHAPDGPTEGNHAQQAPNADHEGVPRSPDVALARQPSQDEQPVAPPPAQRPTRDRRMPSRFKDYYLHTITTDFNKYNMTQSFQQSFLDFPRGGDK